MVLSEDEDVADGDGEGLGLRCRVFRRRRARKGCFSVHEQIQGQLGGRRIASLRFRLAIAAENTLEVDRGVGPARLATHYTIQAAEVRIEPLCENCVRAHAMRAAAAITTAAIAALSDRGSCQASLSSERNNGCDLHDERERAAVQSGQKSVRAGRTRCSRGRESCRDTIGKGELLAARFPLESFPDRLGLISRYPESGKVHLLWLVCSA